MTEGSAYPTQIAQALAERWKERELPAELLPDKSSLVQLLNAAYQATLLREEGDVVQCRIIVAGPSEFEQELKRGDSPLHVLRFSNTTALTPYNLRKLAAAAGYYRGILAVEVNGERGLEIWGMIVTGTSWVNRIEGGRSDGPALPDNLVIQAIGPGHLIAASGYSRVLESAAGKLLTEGFDPFRSQWLPKLFGTVRESLLDEMAVGEEANSAPQMCDSFIKDVAQSVVRRVLRLVRTRAHGGMLVYLPDGTGDKPLIDEWFRFRVRFTPDASSLRFRTLMLRLMKRAREVGEARGLAVVTWNDYQQMQDAELAQVDGALIEFGHFLADLMNVDGSLVLDRSFRLIGFGAEILGDSHVRCINRAVNIEATETIAEPGDSAGTRHRSAYRLVSGFNDAIAVVVSQDGAVRFVAHQNNKLTYWPYLP